MDFKYTEDIGKIMSSDFELEKKNREPVKFGPISYMWGKNGGRFPHDNTLFINDNIKAIVDPGSNITDLKNINDNNDIKFVFDSHYHYDHIRYNYLFPRSKILLHELDAPLFQSLDRIAEAIGLPYLFDDETVEQWKKQLHGGPAYFTGMYNVAYSQEWIWSTKRVDGEFSDGQVYEFGDCMMEVLHTPGHSLGMCCFIFPRQHAAYVTDYDLTPFGPWYGSRHCDLDALITSADKLRKLEGIDWFMTSHEMGIFNKNDFITGLDEFLAIITSRDEKIIELLGKGPKTMDELVRSSIVYKAKHVEDKFTYLWEWNHIEAHVDRLLKEDKIEKEEGLFKLL